MEVDGAVNQLSCMKTLLFISWEKFFLSLQTFAEILTFGFLFILRLFERKADLPLKVVLSVNNA